MEARHSFRRDLRQGNTAILTSILSGFLNHYFCTYFSKLKKGRFRDDYLHLLFKITQSSTNITTKGDV